MPQELCPSSRGRCEQDPHGRGQKDETHDGPWPPGLALSPQGVSFPKGFLMLVPLRPLKDVSTQARSRLTSMVILHTCVCGGRLHVRNVLEVWPSPVPSAVYMSVSPVAGQDGGSSCVTHTVRGPWESHLLLVAAATPSRARGSGCRSGAAVRAEGSGAGGVQTAKASRKQSSLSGKESAQGCLPKRLLGRPD